MLPPAKCGTAVVCITMKESQGVKCGKRAMFLVSREVYRCPSPHAGEEKGSGRVPVLHTATDLRRSTELGLPYIAVE